jgi:DNA-directed RNA polymerase subunit RPC12/RpoP
MKMFSLKCANCAAPLQIKLEVSDFACAYCGVTQIVDRSGGTISLSLVADTLGRVERGTDRTASELALVRLKSERRRFDFDFELTERPGTDQYGSQQPPAVPERKRPTGFFSGMKGALGNSGQKLLHDIDKDNWDEYDNKIAQYNKFVADWPALHEEELKALAAHYKRLSELDAEIAIHRAIVKRV